MTQAITERPFSELCGFHNKQWTATQTADANRYTLYGGSRGPGKSYWLRWYLLRRLLLWAERGIYNVQLALFCETYRELIDRQVTKIQVEFPSWMGQVKDSKSQGFGFYLNREYGGGVIQFRNLDDPTKYQSFEMAGFAIDEVTKTQERTFNILRGSLRWPGISDTFFIGATNPNGRYAEWVRSYWVEHKLPVEMLPIASQFAFVKALPKDNPHLSESYWRDELGTLTGTWRKAWVEGDWYAMSEGVVFDAFSDANICEDAPDMEQTFELGFDDGYIDPRVMLFVQRSGTRIYVFDEIYETKRLDTETIRHMLERCAAWSAKALPDDWELLTLEQASEWCINNEVKLPDIAVGGSESVQLMRRFRSANVTARGGTHDIVQGIKVMRELICDGHGYRTLQIHPRCRVCRSSLGIDNLA